MQSRRDFVRQSLAVSLGFAGLSTYLAWGRAADNPLYAAGEENWIELPPGFSAKLISRMGDTMDDGLLVPGRADGMAAFSVDGRVVVIRNHENSTGDLEASPFGKDGRLLSKVSAGDLYDFGFGRRPSLGGTTTFVFDETRQTITRQFLSLAGTNRNCAGGLTPWNTWISCEEDTTNAGGSVAKNHGYNFEVSASNGKLAVPVPLTAMGRFNHEAVCVDPDTGIVYQTEDRGDGLIYRFIPNRPGNLTAGGRLEALAVRGAKTFDTRNWEAAALPVGKPVDVEWIALSQIDTPDDDLRLRGAALGAAVFARGEGMWFGNREVFFACTNGGLRKSGQVFKYIPSAHEGTQHESRQPGKLVLFAEPNNKDLLKYCDNLTVAPWGDVVFVEDSSNACLRGITPEGTIYNIGRNVGSSSELAGVCFSPSGKTLFVNIQDQGLTYAITGPWHALKKS
jgi:secreted PhoX family phosphatase